jgi:hypothetical protein
MTFASNDLARWAPFEKLDLKSGLKNNSEDHDK